MGEPPSDPNSDRGPPPDIGYAALAPQPLDPMGITALKFIGGIVGGFAASAAAYALAFQARNGVQSICVAVGVTLSGKLIVAYRLNRSRRWPAVGRGILVSIAVALLLSGLAVLLIGVCFAGALRNFGNGGAGR